MKSHSSVSSGPPPPLEDSEWWKAGLVFSFVVLAILAAVFILPRWAPDLYDWLMEPDRLKLAFGALVALILAWRLLAFCLKQNPLDYVGQVRSGYASDKGRRS